MQDNYNPETEIQEIQEDLRDSMARGKHFSQLSPEELERLAILNEEASEVQKAISKIIRHGYYSYDPTGLPEGHLPSFTPNNREMLQDEVGDLLYSLLMMIENSDISLDKIETRMKKRSKSIGQYLHHNAPLIFEDGSTCLCFSMAYDSDDESVRCSICGRNP
jgi:NTP pyrophosphatase (non-canonical NTP hydrolase)